MECWAQLVRSKEGKQDSYPCKVESRRFSDDWLDIDLSISGSVLRSNWHLVETDIVLLRQLNLQKCTMAKVQSYIALPRASGTRIQFTVRCYTKDGPGDLGLQVKTLWQISKVFRYIHSLFCLWKCILIKLQLEYVTQGICSFTFVAIQRYSRLYTAPFITTGTRSRCRRP